MFFNVDPELNSAVVSVECLSGFSRMFLFACETDDGANELFNDMVAFKKIYEDSRDADFHISRSQREKFTIIVGGDLANFIRFLAYTELISDEVCSILMKTQREDHSSDYYRNITPSHNLSMFSAPSTTTQKESSSTQNISCGYNTTNATLEFVNPDTDEPMIVPVSEIVVGDSDYNTINKYPYVYAKKSGYLSVTCDDGIFMLRLNPGQIDFIENFLKNKVEKTAQKNNIISLNTHVM